MGNELTIERLLSKTVGRKMTVSADFDILAQAIEDATGDRLGVNTLKRLFGFKCERVAQRASTLDIIARYLGYSDYQSMVMALGEDADISAFGPVDCIEPEDLEPGARIDVGYEPGRILHLTFMGDRRFRVDAMEGSRNLREGDLLTIAQIAKGHRLVVSHVWRDGEDLGAYEAAKHDGVQTIEILS